MPLTFFEIYSSRKALIYKASHEAISALFINKPDLNPIHVSGMVYTDSTDLSLRTLLAGFYLFTPLGDLPQRTNHFPKSQRKKKEKEETKRTTMMTQSTSQ